MFANLRTAYENIKLWLHAYLGCGSHTFEEDSYFTNGFRWRFCTKEGCHRIEVTQNPVTSPNPVWQEREDGIRNSRLIYRTSPEGKLFVVAPQEDLASKET